MGTVRCERWAVENQLLLIGDAAHAIVPFHGQGMNCAFEDCVVLDRLLADSDDLAAAFSRFESLRLPEANAIADMALENYVEMRDTVRDPRFQLGKTLAFELERRCPDRFIPRYSMVMFHHEIPYSVAQRRGRIQAELLAELTAGAETLADIELDAAEALVRERLPSLAASH
jgi:kynurenine 3-monooxygenase